MARGTLSQQIAASSGEQQQRPTRTQRVQQQFAQRRFEQLKTEAQRVQEEQFRDKTETYEETYYEYRPSNYTEKEWNRLSDNQRNSILRPFSKGRGFEYYAEKGQLVAIPRSRTATRTVPFTLDEGENSYEKVFAKLSPELKQFFLTPDELKQERATRIQTNLSKVEERITGARTKITELSQKYEQEKQKLQEWWQNKSSSYREKNRENYKRNLNDLEDDYEEDVEYQRGIIEGLEKGKGQLAAKKDIDYQTIESYANDIANYYEDRERARNENRAVQQQKMKEIDAAIKEAQQGGSFQRVREEFKGTPQGEKIYAVSPSGKYTLISETKPTKDYSGAKPSELGTSTVTQKYKVGKVELSFTGAEKLFVSPKGSLITPYGDLGVSEAEALESQKQEQLRLQKEREGKADQFLSEKAFESKASAPIDQKRSILGKTWDYIKAGYTATPFGTSVKLPDEYLEARKPVEVGGKAGFVGIGIPTGISLYSLDYGTALAGVKAERQKKLTAEQDIELVNELARITEEAPEELQYDVQQKGIKILESRGIRGELDDKTGLISFTSPSFKTSKSYNIYEYEKAKEKDYITVWDLDKNIATRKKAPYVLEFTSTEKKMDVSLPYQQRGTADYNLSTGRFEAPKTNITIPAKTTTISPYTAAVGTRIVATKAAEFYLVSAAAGAVIGGAAKIGGGIYKGLGGGLKITDATIRGGQVRATVEATKSFNEVVRSLPLGSVFYKPKTYAQAGKVLLYTGATGLYAVGKAKQRAAYKEAYGEAGAAVFKYETIGEVAGIAAFVGQGLYKQAQIKKMNEEIAIKNYQRQIAAQRAKNVKQYGQFSPYAEGSYKGVGTGKKLSKTELSELSRIYSEVTGVPRQEATKRIQESALFKQSLKVKSPAGFKTYEADQYSLLTATKTPKGSQELAFEFSRIRGGKPVNLILKATTGKGKFALTSVFEKGRLRPTQTMDEFILQKQVVSKIVKSRGVRVGDIKIRAFDVEQRLVKSYPYGRERLTVKDALELGLPKYKQSDLARVFSRAGASAKTSPFPIRNIRIETPIFRELETPYGKMKIANILREYQYAQAGKGGRQIALKNILKDIDFKNLERALQGAKTKTPLSTTFGKGVEEDVRQIALKNILRQTSGTKAAKATAGVQQQRSTSAYAGTGLYERTGDVAMNIPKINAATVDFSPTVRADLKIKVLDKLLPSVSTASVSSQSAAIVAAVRGALGLRTQSALKAELRQKSLTQQATQQKQNQQQQQEQSQAQRSAQVQIPTFEIPQTPFNEITPTTTTTTRPFVPARPAFANLDSDRLLKKLLKQKKEKGIDVAYLIPDFASKALGIEPMEVGSQAEALRAINAVQTGLELRRGIVIRSRRNKTRARSERSLTRGIMN